MVETRAIASAETLAALRAVVSGEHRLAVACEDRFARQFLGLRNRILSSIRPQALIKAIYDLAVPGSYCFTIARTRCFDDALLAALRCGVDQVVLLGAGYDSRAYRFRDEMAHAVVFEVDHPGTQARKLRILQRRSQPAMPNLRYVPVDFATQLLADELHLYGFSTDRPAVFLWEGVSYYLPQDAVESILDMVAGCAPGSSIVFDYAIKSFVDGDTSTYGGKQIAKWLERIGEPFLFGLDPDATADFLTVRGLELVSDFGPPELEARYLTTRRGTSLGRTLGHVRMAQARVPGA
jgi:methyltransferase (TIGR00027 family)